MKRIFLLNIIVFLAVASEGQPIPQNTKSTKVEKKVDKYGTGKRVSSEKAAATQVVNIICNAKAELWIDGKKKGVLASNEPSKYYLPLGDYILQFVSPANELDRLTNAVVAADIDYSEVGGDKGMLMVCMTGTAVLVENTEVLQKGKIESINELVRLNERESYLKGISPNTG